MCVCVCLCVSSLCVSSLCVSLSVAQCIYVSASMCLYVSVCASVSQVAGSLITPVASAAPWLQLCLFLCLFLCGLSLMSLWVSNARPVSPPWISPFTSTPPLASGAICPAVRRYTSCLSCFLPGMPAATETPAPQSTRTRASGAVNNAKAAARDSNGDIPVVRRARFPAGAVI